MSLPLRSLAVWSSVFVLLIILILNFFVFSKSEEESFYQALQARIQKVDQEFDEDFIQVLMDVRPEDSLSNRILSLQKHRHPFFVLDSSGELIFWSDFTLTLDVSKIQLNLTYQVLEDPYGTFLLKTRKTKRNNKEYFLVHATRLILPGTIENDFIQSGPNPEYFGNDRFQVFSNPEEGRFVVKSESGIAMFGINFLLGYEPVGKVYNTPLLVFIGSVFLLYFLLSFDFLKKKWKKGYPWQTIGYGLLIILAIRTGMIWSGFPRDFFELPLFNPVHYASSLINPSLGDLLLNTLGIGVILGLVIFQLTTDSVIKKLSLWINHSKNFILIGGAFGISSLFFGLVFFLPRDLIFNSQWVLDIRSIPSFDVFKGLSLLILFVWSGIYVLGSLTVFSVLDRLGINQKLLQQILLGIGIVLAVPLAFLGLWWMVVWGIHIFFLWIIIQFKLYFNVFRLGLNTFLTFFFGGLITAAVSGISTHQADRDRLIQSKISFANQNLIENDVMTEFFLGDIFARIKSDLFIQNRLADPLLSKEPIETKIRKIYLDNYFDQFEVSVWAFSSNGNQLLGPQGDLTLETLRREFVKSDFATGVRDLYFIRSRESSVNNKFVGFIPLVKDNDLLGTLVFELRQLRVQPGSVYPRLLLNKKYADKLEPSSFDYGVFRDNILIRSSGSFNYVQGRFLESLQKDALYTTGLGFDGYHHLGIKNGDEIFVISSANPSFSQFFANISLFFVAFVFLTFLAVLLNTLVKGYRNFEFNYSTKLQLYLNFAFFFPIIIISIITIGLLSGSYQDDLHRQYIQKANLIKGNLSTFFNNQNPENLDRDVLNEEINELANTVASDIHLYSPSGILESTNRSNIFEKKILSPYINPRALAGIEEEGQIQLLLDEQVGKLRYKSVYLAIPSQVDNSLSGILAVPFFESEAELDSLIADVLSNIFNAFVIIFILFLIVSSIVSKNLTLPFRLLTQKLKTTNLENNEPMYWSSKDEIGLLVNEYNNMLFKLEASKKVLASTEKESAWREMAKQVAHEIKNPLTPMKLTLQHLLRLDQEGKLTDQERLRKSLETLIHQVDALSGIASSFSTFAKMPLPKNEPMNFKAVLVKVLELFNNDRRIQLEFRDDSYTEQIPIMGDDKLFGRVISNLIINGIQAVSPDKVPQIKIWLWMTEQAVFLEISDNGKGIPQELKDKIFVPNFSTKSQGSGLGLAIAKSGVETAGGKIWFETEVGKGTTFYLTFPLIQ